LSDEIVHTAIIGGDPLFREGLRRILQDTRYRVDLIARSIGEVAGHREKLDLLLLLGFSSDDPQFLDTLSALRVHWPEARVVAIAENRADQLIAALKAEVHGYLARYISAEALLRFLSLIVLGQRIFSMRSLDLPKHFDQGAGYEEAAHAVQAGRIDSQALTARERALLALLVEGKSNKLIARQLGLAEATVKSQMAKLFDKIGAANRTQAAVLAWAGYRASPLAPSGLSG
jgi:two-component system, NarL family, nitrate/nitrite response regulator NarL